MYILLSDRHYSRELRKLASISQKIDLKRILDFTCDKQYFSIVPSTLLTHNLIEINGDRMPLETKYQVDQDKIDNLLSPKRDSTLDMLSILTFSEISRRDNVADIGCGPGYFALKLAKAVIDGKLYAVDTNPQMVDICQQQITSARLGNVEVMLCDQFDFNLEDNSLDGAFLAFVIHESTDHIRLLQSVGKLLKPNGWITILEWSGKESQDGPSMQQQLVPARLRELSYEAGLRYRNWRDINDNQYMMTLRNR